METRSKKRKLDSIKEAERVESIAKFIKAITPLFDEFCEFVGLTGQLKSLQDVQRNLTDFKYADSFQLVNDMKKVAVEMKTRSDKKNSDDKSEEATQLQRYNEIAEYNQQTFVPLIYAPAILYELQQHRRDIKINSNHELVQPHREFFRVSTRSEQLKMYLTWPLPKITGDITKIKARANDTSRTVKNTISTATTGTTTSNAENMMQDSGSDLLVTQSSASKVSSHVKVDSKDTFKAPHGKEEKQITFTIGRTKYEVGIIGFKEASKYQMLVNKQNHLDRSGFLTKYVNEYLNSGALEGCMKDIMAPSEFAQECARDVEDEGCVETILEESLYKIIRPLVESSLDACKEKVPKEIKTIIREKPHVTVLSEGDKDDIPLVSKLSNQKIGATFLGLSIHADLEIGYFANFMEPEGSRAVFYSALAEVKYITMEIQPCIDRMQGQPNSLATDSRLSQFKRSLSKYTTSCVFLGVSRFAVTDLKSFVFIKLTFEDAPEDEAALDIEQDLKIKKALEIKASKNKNASKIDASTKETAPNKEEAVDAVSSKNILKGALESEGAPISEGTSKTDTQDATDDSKNAKYIKSERSVFSMHDPYVRLYCASFFSVNEKYIDELTEFKRAISDKMSCK